MVGIATLLGIIICSGDNSTTSTLLEVQGISGLSEIICLVQNQYFEHITGWRHDPSYSLSQ